MHWLLLLLLTAVAAQEYCNQETEHYCACPSCWDDLPLSGTIDWITVDTTGCGAIDELGLRTKLATWSTEECGSSVHCGIALPIQPEQVLLGQLVCNATTRAGTIALALLRTPTTNLSQDSLLPAAQLGAILHAREHLLAIALRAHLTSVQITRYQSSVVPRRTTVPRTSTMVPPPATVAPYLPSLGIGLAVGCFGAALLGLVLYAVWGRIEWKRLAQGRWRTGLYRKVPDVMFRSADEMPTVIPHSVSLQSTAHLIRY